MENAGSAVADFVLQNYPEAMRISVVCGKGNNGGDGFVAARKLREVGREVVVVLLADPERPAGRCGRDVQRMGFASEVASNSSEFAKARAKLGNADLLVDAILGTGFRPPVSGLYAEAIAAINATETPVVAVDIPSGADADAMGPQVGAVARRRRDCYVHGAASGACFRRSDGRANCRCAHWIPGRGGSRPPYN